MDGIAITQVVESNVEEEVLYNVITEEYPFAPSHSFQYPDIPQEDIAKMIFLNEGFTPDSPQHLSEELPLAPVEFSPAVEYTVYTSQQCLQPNSVEEKVSDSEDEEPQPLEPTPKKKEGTLLRDEIESLKKKVKFIKKRRKIWEKKMEIEKKRHKKFTNKIRKELQTKILLSKRVNAAVVGTKRGRKLGSGVKIRQELGLQDLELQDEEANEEEDNEDHDQSLESVAEVPHVTTRCGRPRKVKPDLQEFVIHSKAAKFVITGGLQTAVEPTFCVPKQKQKQKRRGRPRKTWKEIQQTLNGTQPVDNNTRAGSTTSEIEAMEEHKKDVGNLPKENNGTVIKETKRVVIDSESAPLKEKDLNAEEAAAEPFSKKLIILTQRLEQQTTPQYPQFDKSLEVAEPPAKKEKTEENLTPVQIEPKKKAIVRKKDLYQGLRRRRRKIPEQDDNENIIDKTNAVSQVKKQEVFNALASEQLRRRRSEREVKFTEKLADLVQESNEESFAHLLQRGSNLQVAPSSSTSPIAEKSSIPEFILWHPGDVVWTGCSTPSYWPCIVIQDPFAADEYIKETSGPEASQLCVHVQFLRDRGRRAWCPVTDLASYHGLPALQAQFTIDSSAITKTFLKAVENADRLLQMLPMDRLVEMRRRQPMERYAEGEQVEARRSSKPVQRFKDFNLEIVPSTSKPPDVEKRTSRRSSKSVQQENMILVTPTQGHAEPIETRRLIKSAQLIPVQEQDVISLPATPAEAKVTPLKIQRLQKSKAKEILDSNVLKSEISKYSADTSKNFTNRKPSTRVSRSEKSTITISVDTSNRKEDPIDCQQRKPGLRSRRHVTEDSVVAAKLEEVVETNSRTSHHQYKKKEHVFMSPAVANKRGPSPETLTAIAPPLKKTKTSKAKLETSSSKSEPKKVERRSYKEVTGQSSQPGTIRRKSLTSRLSVDNEHTGSGASDLESIQSEPSSCSSGMDIAREDKRAKIFMFRGRGNEKICEVCLGVRNEPTYLCSGVCRGYFHASCVKKHKPLQPVQPLPKDWKCTYCECGQNICFVCKDNSGTRQMCLTAGCGKFYHTRCLKLFPQTKLNHGQRKNVGLQMNPASDSEEPPLEILSCARHFCHTCSSDNPALASLVPMEKLVCCVKCPTSYHPANFCLPAGSEVLTHSAILCGKHFEPGGGKGAHHVNITWCFICTKGGSLICCDTCPSALHAECLQLKPPEGSYVCEECESGRFPLHGEVVWAKLGSYRWWPSRVLYPHETPLNMLNMSRRQCEFVVQFYGTHDHAWLNRRQVYLYHEGDTGYERRPKAKRYDASFQRALKEAAEHFSFRKKALTQCHPTANAGKPHPYKTIRTNKYLPTLKTNGGHGGNQSSVCDCDPNEEEPCGVGSNCLNRVLLIECQPSRCPAKQKCCNQRFDKRQYPPLKLFKTNNRGWGLRSPQDLVQGQFVIEYVGQVIDDEELRRRMKLKQDAKDVNYYFLRLDQGRILDAGPMGNLARFINHSCDPNCETQKWSVNGLTRIGLFASRDIPAGTELTFNYDMDCVGGKTACCCGATNCSGFIGDATKIKKPKDEGKMKSRRKFKKSEKSRESKATESICFLCGKGGELMVCDAPNCTQVAHVSCAGLEEWPNNPWFCRRHLCAQCGQRTKQICVACDTAFCAKHTEGYLYTSVDGRLFCNLHIGLGSQITSSSSRASSYLKRSEPEAVSNASSEDLVPALDGDLEATYVLWDQNGQKVVLQAEESGNTARVVSPRKRTNLPRSKVFLKDEK